MPVAGLTPGPENVPPNGVPPLSLKGLALIVVTESKQVMKLTFGASEPVMMIVPELAGLNVTQLRFEVITHLMLSLLAGLYANTGEFVPALVPLTIHWNAGEAPPLTGTAVIVIVNPGQKGLADAAMVIPAGRLVFTAMVIGFDKAGSPVMHVSEDASKHVTTSPFTG